MLRRYWILISVFSVLIGLYPAIYFLVDREFGLLGLKEDALLQDTFWNIAFYLHIVPGGLTLLTGWAQFNSKLRNRHLNRHRLLGKIYVFSALLSALAGIYIGFYATGGSIAAAGFILLGVCWFYSTFMAYLHVRKQRIEAHQRMMIYSYAACLAAVTLRIWNPILVPIMGDFVSAYRIVAWLCWVPNLAIAYWLVEYKLKAQVSTSNR
jgi:uncharacterized membrane protein